MFQKHLYSGAGNQALLSAPWQTTRTVSSAHCRRLPSDLHSASCVAQPAGQCKVFGQVAHPIKSSMCSTGHSASPMRVHAADGSIASGASGCCTSIVIHLAQFRRQWPCFGEPGNQEARSAFRVVAGCQVKTHVQDSAALLAAYLLSV